MGYYALCAAMIHRADVSRNIKGGRAPTEIPVALIARMAVDSNHQKQKLVSALLRNALLNVVSAAQAIAFRAVVVHAIDKKAESFYRYHGFSDTKGIEGRLILSTKDILQSVDAVCNTEAKS